MDLVEPLVELYRRMSCELPVDVVSALEAAQAREVPGSSARRAIATLLDDVKLARELGRPLCQDTGLPVFYVRRPVDLREREVLDAVRAATRKATRGSLLRPNAVDPLTGENSGDNTGVDFPIIHLHEHDGPEVIVEAMLKGGGCENVGMRYKLPDASLGAARDLEGVRRCVLHAVFSAQGRACPPYVLGVAIGGARDATAALAKRQLLRPLAAFSRHGAGSAGGEQGCPSRDGAGTLLDLERRLCDECNELGIGPAGLGGRTTVLGVNIGVQHRHCACYYVEVAFGCWAMRRARAVIGAEGVRYD